MDLRDFSAHVNSAQRIVFRDLLPRFLKKHGKGPSLVHDMFQALEEERLDQVVLEIPLRQGGWLSRWLDRRNIGLARRIEENVPVRVEQEEPTSSECVNLLEPRRSSVGLTRTHGPARTDPFAWLTSYESRKADEARKQAADQAAYERLRSSLSARRVAAFRHTYEEQVELGIFGQVIDTKQQHNRRWVEVYFASWHWLNEVSSGTLFANTGKLQEQLTYVLFHELIHAVESIPGYPSPLADKDEHEFKTSCNLLNRVLRSQQ